MDTEELNGNVSDEVTLNGTIKLDEDLYGVIDNDFFNGMSAYQLAVKNGYVGTEEEWLESLKYDHSEEFEALKTQIIESVDSFNEDYVVKVAEMQNKYENIISDLNAKLKESEEEIDDKKDEAIEVIEKKEEEILTTHVEDDILVF